MSTPANARRTGKPSPSKPDGAVVTQDAAADRTRERARAHARQGGGVLDGHGRHAVLLG